MNFRSLRSLLAVACCGVAFSTSIARPAWAQGEFERMMWLVPDSANALVLVRAAALFDTPIALKDGWAEEDAASSPLSSINPEAEYVVFGSRIAIADGMTPDWELALVSLGGPVEPSAIADAEGGALDTSGPVPIVWSPRGLFYAAFGPDLIGLYTPVDRQAVMRWATAARDRSDAVVSPYLREASRAFQGDEAQFVMAIDLGDLSSPEQLRPHVARATSVDIKVDDVDAIAESLASVRGATLKIEADAEIYGRLAIDFDASTAPVKRIAKPLLNEVLAGLGADLDEIRDWSILVEDRAITFRGPVSTDMARRIGSLVSLPTGAADGTPASPQGEPASVQPESPAGTVTVAATKHYFNSIEALLDDLNDKAVDQRRVALWCDRYADKIDHFSILGVDPEAVDFGGKVVITLRNLANIAKGKALNVSARRTTDAATEAGYGGGYYGYGYGMSIGGTSELAMSRINRQEEVKAQASETEIWTEMTTQTGVMRRTLSQRYQVDF